MTFKPTFPPSRAVRRALALLLVVLASAGCLQATYDGLRNVAPVVLVEHDFEVTGEGSAQGFFGVPCEMARFHRHPAEVTLFRPDGFRGTQADFVVLQDLGDSWRAANRTAEPGYTLVGVYAGSGGGPIPWIRGSSRSMMGMATPFREAPLEGREVAWDGERALYDGKPLEEDVPATRVFEYDVPTDEGGSLHVRETVTVTYLGKVRVTLQETACAPRVT